MTKTGPAIPPLRVKRTYPREEQGVRLRPMEAGDREAMLEFARRLPEEDLLFLQRDITRDDVVARWVESIESGRQFTVLAEEAGALAGYGSLYRRDLLWTRHLGEIRIITSPVHRGAGLGALLAREMLAVARDADLQRIVAQMPREQAGARHMFRKLGFDLESMLADWVIDREGDTHDLVIMAYDVSE